MKAINQTTMKEIATNVTVVTGILKRMKGLLGKESMSKGEALLIKPCKSIHTFGMRFPIDVIFLDKDGRIVAMKKNMKPNRLSSIYMKAVSVLELPSGIIESTLTNIGDKIAFIPKSDMENSQ